MAGLPASLGALTDPSVTLSRLHDGRSGNEHIAFTLTLLAYSNHFPLYSYEDVVAIRTGQVDTLLTFIGANSFFDLNLERKLDASASAHLRSLRLVFQAPAKT